MLTTPSIKADTVVQVRILPLPSSKRRVKSLLTGGPAFRLRTTQSGTGVEKRVSRACRLGFGGSARDLVDTGKDWVLRVIG